MAQPLPHKPPSLDVAHKKKENSRNRDAQSQMRLCVSASEKRERGESGRASRSIIDFCGTGREAVQGYVLELAC